MGRLVIRPQWYDGEIAPTKSILQVLLEQRFPIHFSCRRGLCGQDLIRVIQGWEFLNPIGDAEDGTLILLRAREQQMRMACCAKVIGDGEVIVEVV
jgi:ferredoxin